MELLTQLNARRVKSVVSLEHPEAGVYDFEYCKVPSGGIMSNNDHLLKNRETGEEIVIGYEAVCVMKKWAVNEKENGVDLSVLYDEAVRSYGWSSFNPERNARVMIHRYEDCLEEDLKTVPETDREEYIQGFIAQARTVISANSRVASAFVTGPAKFNNRRNQKANNAYDHASENFDKWRERKLLTYRNLAELAKSPEQRADEEWAKYKRELLGSLKVILDIDINKSPWSRQAFVNSIVNKAVTLAKNGKKEVLRRYIDEVKKYNDTYKKPAVTSRSKLWSLMDMCEESVEKKEERESRDSVEIKCDSCIIVKNFAEDRLQLYYDGKPDYQTIQLLKHNGFRWAPSSLAWQRQLTDNAYYSASRITGVPVQDIRTA